MTKSADPLDPDLFNPSQARDERFVVVDRWQDLVTFPDGTPERNKEFLHRQMNEEVNVLEQAAQSLVDFPSADWGIRKSLARQAADEARHALFFIRMMKRRGVSIGDYPVQNFVYRAISKVDSLLGRLALVNRTFEADAVDATAFGVQESREAGDLEMTELFDVLHAEEMSHLSFGVRWVNARVKENPASLMVVAAAMSRASKAFAQVFESAPAGRHPVSVADRIQAGFTPAEVEEAVRLSEAGRKAAPPTEVGQPSGATSG